MVIDRIYNFRSSLYNKIILTFSQHQTPHSWDFLFVGCWVDFSMKHPWLILPVISLLVAEQNDAIKPTNLEIDQIKYNEQKLLVKQVKMNWYQIFPFEIFYVSILKRPARWTVNRGNGRLIRDEEFFRITESTQEQILLKKQLKLSRQQLFLSSISFVVGGMIAIVPQTGNAGGYIGNLVCFISMGVLVEGKINSVYPVISFESAKIIAEHYNKNLLSEYSH